MTDAKTLRCYMCFGTAARNELAPIPVGLGEERRNELVCVDCINELDD